MSNNKLLEFVKCADYSDNNINYYKSENCITNKQLIRDLFGLLKSILKVYDKSIDTSKIINNTINLIRMLCTKETFTPSEIEINKIRIKKIRKLLYPYINDNEINLKSMNLLDEIILDKTISAIQLKTLIKKLIDKFEDVEIIKKFINLNKAVFLDDSELFDYVFSKTIIALKEDNRDVYYYITLLKILYNTEINKNNYLNELEQFEKDIITNEIEFILTGNKKPYDGKKIFDKYGIITNPRVSIITSKSNIHPQENIITIDSKGTQLRDDAISIRKDGNKYIVKIYITNPSKVIKIGGNVDKDALNNFKSIYLPNYRIHMLNKKVESMVSLDKNKLRNVFALTVVINDSGEILDYKLKRDIVTISENLTYDYVDNILCHSKKNDDYYFLNTLRSLALALRSNNNKKVEYWKLKDNANKVTNRLESEKLISEYMILYNRILPKIAIENNIPYTYRGKDKQYITDLMNELNIEVNSRIEKILLNLFLDSTYSKDPIFHHGLGFEYYSHSSNTGRRYVDFHNQYLMNKYYFEKHSLDDFDYDKFELLIEYFNKRDRELSLMQAEYTRALSLKK